METVPERLTTRLRERLTDIVSENDTPWLLFSGGVDTAVLSSIFAKLGRKVKAVTITLESSGEDLGYARLVAKVLGLHHYHVPVTIKSSISAIPGVIKALKSFDPAIPNDVVVYFGMKYIKAHGGDTVMTGDGADEVFAGYDFMQQMGDGEAARFIEQIAPHMIFGSNLMAYSFGLKVIQPFLDQQLIALALEIPMDLKIRQEQGRVFGKWILRKAFEDLLPREVAWQHKRALEYGSGMTRLRQTIDSIVPDKEYNNHPYPIKFMNKEHYYYYKIYREVIGDIPEPSAGEKACPVCSAGMKIDSFHCQTCGNVLDWRCV